ncbi:hypothetical protein CBR_g3837 [Chara braunii]|uniref:Uncharacterized protein n=1 Tax=Chara braunii TaxID=69332 RepID=A0A388KGJ6_CHABU|nr:hypothetical protein CBR_g3837 [Chara braunii]|eukprot:GBG69138.1 hypothetical protein CBR_g3837 [Chara braunii]
MFRLSRSASGSRHSRPAEPCQGELHFVEDSNAAYYDSESDDGDRDETGGRVISSDQLAAVTEGREGRKVSGTSRVGLGIRHGGGLQTCAGRKKRGGGKKKGGKAKEGVGKNKKKGKGGGRKKRGGGRGRRNADVAAYHLQEEVTALTRCPISAADSCSDNDKIAPSDADVAACHLQEEVSDSVHWHNVPLPHQMLTWQLTKAYRLTTRSVTPELADTSSSLYGNNLRGQLHDTSD